MPDALLDRGGLAPSITGGCAANHLAQRMPIRVPRTRKKYAVTPPGAIYVGRPTIWANPFKKRAGIGHARAVILYGAWLRGDLTTRILQSLRFSFAEIDALNRWRLRLLPRLRELRGKNLQCWCPVTAPWCHADTLLKAAQHA